MVFDHLDQEIVMPHRLNQFKLFKHLLAAATVLALSAHVWAEEAAADPVATRQALAALLASSNSRIPDTSTCQGNYGQDEKPMVKNLMAMQLAYLYSGINTIEGRCIADLCSITIKHVSGEELSSAIINFEVSKGKANAASMRCLITP